LTPDAPHVTPAATRPRNDSRHRIAALLDVDPDLGEFLTPEGLAAARQELAVRVVRLPRGAWNTDRLAGAAAGHLGLLVLDGVIAHEVLTDDLASMELLGPGDVLRPWQVLDRALLLRATERWSVFDEARLAVLDRALAAKLTGYPEVYSVIVERLVGRSQRLTVMQAISQLNRVDRRLLTLFWHLAERWGRITPAGVHVPLALSHRTIAQLVGARRPTVSTALAHLAEAGELARRSDGTWLLTGEPTGEPDAERRRLVPPRRRMLAETDADGQATKPESAAILERITDAYYSLDRDWRFTYVNQHALDLLAPLKGGVLARGDLLGKRIWEEFPLAVEHPAYASFQRVARDAKAVVLRYQYPEGDGPWWDVHLYPTDDGGVAAYFRDVTEEQRADEERELRSRQQALVAELGRRALAGDDIQALLDEATALVAATLDVDLAEVAQLLADGSGLLIRAGVGWSEGTVGSAIEPVGGASQAGYTLAAGAPVVTDALAAERRFDRSAVVEAHGAVSAVTVPISGREDSFGVLGALSTSGRRFQRADADFLQAVANVLATAVERSGVEQRLLDVREVERRRIARGLHDEALQDLAEAMTQASADGHASVTTLLERVGEQLRGAIYDLRLGGEASRPFPELLEGLVEVHRAMAPRHEIVLELGDGVPEGPLGATGTETLRIVGEALTNARRHAGAHRVDVRVSRSGASLRAEVTDDGCGFDPAAVPGAGCTGIHGMFERAALVHGRLRILSEPGAGASVCFQVTLPRHGEAEAGPVRVLLVEDHAAVREAIAAVFGREPGFRVVGQAASLAEARRMLHDVDVALVDLGLPDGDGADLIAELREASPQAQALVLSARLDRAEVARAVQRGAAGVFDKVAHLEEIVAAVRRLHGGEPLLPMDEVAELTHLAARRREREHADREAMASLTGREREVLQALAEGLSGGEIAERLHISARTERNHIASILAKLGVHSRLEALVFALRYGLVEVRGAAASEA
jgi:DNA-binding NarL/FixJ family response regulator/signal transduction histidine kinase/PAS domain-containing protein